MSLSKKSCNFVVSRLSNTATIQIKNRKLRYANLRPFYIKSSFQERRHRGEQTDFCPSENLENSRIKAKRLKGAPPVYLHIKFQSFFGIRVDIYGCELNFHSFDTGNPEPSDGECQEGSHFVSQR